jgi:hypothetical protein
VGVILVAVIPLVTYIVFAVWAADAPEPKSPWPKPPPDPRAPKGVVAGAEDEIAKANYEANKQRRADEEWRAKLPPKPIPKPRKSAR